MDQEEKRAPGSHAYEARGGQTTYVRTQDRELEQFWARSVGTWGMLGTLGTLGTFGRLGTLGLLGALGACLACRACVTGLRNVPNVPGERA